MQYSICDKTRNGAPYKEIKLSDTHFYWISFCDKQQNWVSAQILPFRKDFGNFATEEEAIKACIEDIENNE